MKKLAFFLKNLCHPLGIISILLSFSIPLTIYLLPKEILRELDLNLPLPLFFVQTFIGLLLLILLHKDIRSFLKALLPSKIYLVALIIFTVAVTLLAGTQIEARHRVQSDESVFLSLAQNMFHNHISGTCNQGEFEQGKLQCHVNSNSFKTKGLSYLYFLGIGLLGGDLHWAFNAQLMALAFTVLLFFFALLAWTKEPSFSLLATALLALQPTLLFQFRSLSVEPLYILLFSLSLLVVRFAFEYNKWKHWLFAALVLAFFAQTRQETVFCLLAFLVLALPKLLDSKNAKAPIFFLALSLFSVPVLLTISYYQNFNFQGGAFDAHGHFFEHLRQNWIVMTDIETYRNLPRNPFLPYFNYLTLFGLLCLLVFVGKDIYSKGFGPSAQFALFLLFFHIQTYVILENVSGDFTIEINQRYSLVFFPTMAMLAAYPFALFSKWCIRKKQPASFIATACLILVASLSAYTFSYKDAFNANIMYNRNHLTTEEQEIWKWLYTQENLQEKLFIYARPYHFIGYGLSAIHYDRVRRMNKKELQELLDKYPEGVYYIRGLDCWDSKTYHKKAVEHRIPTTCDHFERDMALEPIYNTLITNNYYLEISTFQGKRSHNQSMVLSHRKTEKLDSAYKLIFKLSAKHKLPWEVKAFIGENEIYSAPYQYMDSLVILANTQEVGYKPFTIKVVDPVGKSQGEYKTHLLFGNDSVLSLVQINPDSHFQKWGGLEKNRSVEQNPLKVANQVFKEGLGLHAPSKTVYSLDGAYDSLSMFAGLDEEKLCSDGATLKVYVDNQLQYVNHLDYKKLNSIGLSLKGARSLMIETDSLSSMDCDHVDILLPTLYKAN